MSLSVDTRCLYWFKNIPQGALTNSSVLSHSVMRKSISFHKVVQPVYFNSWLKPNFTD